MSLPPNLPLTTATGLWEGPVAYVGCPVEGAFHPLRLKERSLVKLSGLLRGLGVAGTTTRTYCLQSQTLGSSPGSVACSLCEPDPHMQHLSASTSFSSLNCNEYYAPSKSGVEINYYLTWHHKALPAEPQPLTLPCLPSVLIDSQGRGARDFTQGLT